MASTIKTVSAPSTPSFVPVVKEYTLKAFNYEKEIKNAVSEYKRNGSSLRASTVSSTGVEDISTLRGGTKAVTAFLVLLGLKIKGVKTIPETIKPESYLVGLDNITPSSPSYSLYKELLTLNGKDPAKYGNFKTVSSRKKVDIIKGFVKSFTFGKEDYSKELASLKV